MRPNAIIGKFFRHLRTMPEHNLSQADILQRIGWSQDRVSKLETARRPWTAVHMDEAAELFGYKCPGCASQHKNGASCKRSAVFHRAALDWWEDRFAEKK
jgi:hypothetical protein